MLVFPTLAACFACVCYIISLRVKYCKKRKPKFTAESIKSRVYNLSSLLIFSLYAGLSTKIFLLFKCKEIQGKFYLTSDYRVVCFEDTWWNFGAVAIFCILVYVIGIPLVQFILLIKNRKHLHESRTIDHKAHRLVKKQFGSIYKYFNEDCFYFELVDLMRRLILTGGLILVGEHSVAQMLLGILTALIWFSVVALKFPYKAYWDNILQLVLSFGLLLSLVSGMALKLYAMEVTHGRDGPIAVNALNNSFEQKFFDALLVTICIICICTGLFALIITMPGGKTFFVTYFHHLDNSKHGQILRWVEKQKLVIKWLGEKQVANVLETTENSLKALMVEKVQQKQIKRRSTLQNNAKQKDQSTVYPIALLRHLYKKKPSVADFAKLKMEAAVQQKRKMMRKMMLPAALSEKKPLRGGTKSVEDQVANLENSIEHENIIRKQSTDAHLASRRKSLQMRIQRRKSTRSGHGNNVQIRPVNKVNQTRNVRAEAESNYQTVNVRAEAESTNYSPKGDSDDDEYEILSDENDSEEYT